MADEVIAGRYRLLEPLGRGAMSSVWLAQDEELERKVAVKMLAQNADRARFEREARAAAALSHPNICALYDYGEADGRPYMVLEFLPNGSLEERLKGGPLPDTETVRLATALAEGLAHAHERGLVHRDLKPANVLFDVEDRAKIADFGIARMGGSGTLTEAGTVLGTATYISPEQASGRTAGPASDVYSFGVILFRMLTGRLPFVSTNAMELVRMHRDDLPPSVADFRSNAPARLESLAAAALAKDPADRPADGGALLRELRGAGGGEATMLLAPGTSPAASDATQVLRPVRPPVRRKREYWLVPLVLLLLAGGIALALLTTSGGGSANTTTPLTGLSLPTVATAGSTQPTTTAPPTTAATTTTETTTAQTAKSVTTAPVPPATSPTVLPTTTVAPLPTTTVPPATTTAPPTTSDTTPTTTVATTTGP